MPELASAPLQDKWEEFLGQYGYDKEIAKTFGKAADSRRSSGDRWAYGSLGVLGKVSSLIIDLQALGAGLQGASSAVGLTGALPQAVSSTAITGSFVTGFVENGIRINDEWEREKYEGLSAEDELALRSETWN